MRCILKACLIWHYDFYLTSIFHWPPWPLLPTQHKSTCVPIFGIAVHSGVSSGEKITCFCFVCGAVLRCCYAAHQLLLLHKHQSAPLLNYKVLWRMDGWADKKLPCVLKPYLESWSAFDVNLWLDHHLWMADLCDKSKSAHSSGTRGCCEYPLRQAVSEKSPTVLQKWVGSISGIYCSTAKVLPLLSFLRTVAKNQRFVSLLCRENTNLHLLSWIICPFHCDDGRLAHEG